MEKKDTLLSIGQFAALHGINKKTLMWYDETGLFRPAAIHPENGYRYYSYHQSSILETILLLRELGVSIGEIQGFMQNRSAASLEQLLQERIDELDRTLAHLRSVRKTLANHRQNMLTLLHMDLAEIRLVEKEERRLVTVDINQDTPFEKQVEMITAETKKYQLRRLHDASYGTMIAVEKLHGGDFTAYSKLFIEIPFPIKEAGLHVQPGGSYLRAFYQGPWDDQPQRYQEILGFAQKQGWTLAGYAYETILNEPVIDRMEDAIIQIEIPAEPS